MSRTGTCWDTAVMERLFAARNAEIGTALCDSHTPARSRVFDYIERFYNRQRRHATRAYLTPVKHERRWFE
jgi:putative transposase